MNAFVEIRTATEAFGLQEERAEWVTGFAGFYFYNLANIGRVVGFDQKLRIHPLTGWIASLYTRISSETDPGAEIGAFVALGTIVLERAGIIEVDWEAGLAQVTEFGVEESFNLFS
jgi:hypothetical protein